ncbi:hypothetical protein PILCRDRAFT_815294 [Piloderma croceum F 1598]|uniref:Uncharacterized protein n=1 Tax=Piloderma croceum (strain F 1598) TaxID=765440 RepID=A0A0C3CAX4_PILCF|nr:hypothetical protein PILCRDRAFT_815294 [Piloderma croceum F 1598]
MADTYGRDFTASGQYRDGDACLERERVCANIGKGGTRAPVRHTGKSATIGQENWEVQSNLPAKVFTLLHTKKRQIHLWA